MFDINDRNNSGIDINEIGFVDKKVSRFVCGDDVQVFIDNIYVEEIALISYEEVVNRVPYYGYDSQLFDYVFEGRKIVSGQILVNIHTPQFLYRLLNELGYGYVVDKGTGSYERVGEGIDVKNEEEFYKAIAQGQVDNVVNNPVRYDYVLSKFFDISLYINKVYDLKYKYFIHIKDVYLTGHSVKVVNDDALYEVYTFLARDVVSSVNDSGS